MNQRAAALLCALLAGMLALLIWLPARWVTPWVKDASRGAVALVGVNGTIWSGSAWVEIAPAAGVGQAPLVLPERLSWTVDAAPLFTARLQARVRFGDRPWSALLANLNGFTLAPGATAMNARELVAAGAPLNSMQPGGWLDVRWDELRGVRDGRAMVINGQLQALWTGATTRLSGAEPLGDYALEVRLSGQGTAQSAQLQLNTRNGRLQINGQGQFAAGARPQFRLVSTASESERERLAAVLNLLGRRQNNEYVLSLGS
jgi:general secretion pathway protein N